MLEIYEEDSKTNNVLSPLTRRGLIFGEPT